MKTALLLRGMLVVCLVGTLTDAAYSQNQTQSYSEHFDQTSLPSGWTNSNNNGSTATRAFWLFNSGWPFYDIRGIQDHTQNGGTFAGVDGSTPFNVVCTLETKSFDFFGYRDLELEFWHASYNITSPASGHNDFSVDYFDGASWHVGVFTQKGDNPSASWHKKTVDLSGFPLKGAKQVKLRFIINKNAPTPFNNDIVIDDITLSGEIDAFGQNNASINRIDMPPAICAGNNDIKVVVENKGKNLIDSVVVNWEINGVGQSPVKVIGTLDTLYGTGKADTNVFLTTLNFPKDSLIHIKIWTSLPNGQPDTVNYNDTVFRSFFPALQGTYSVGDTFRDFINIQDAVSTLNQYGVCSPVVFELKDTTHTARIEILEFLGSSLANTVTFRSESGSRMQCILTDTTLSSSTNDIVRLTKASYVIFEDMSIINGSTNSNSRVFNLIDQCSGILLRNCYIKSGYTSGTSNNAALVYNERESITQGFIAEDNLFEGGSWAINIEGRSTHINQHIEIHDNEFKDQYRGGAIVGYATDVYLYNNDLHSSISYNNATALQAYWVDGDLSIYGNSILSTSEWPRYGILLSQNQGTRTNRHWVYNNIISLGDTNVTDDIHGIRIFQSVFTNVAHNTVSLYGTDLSSTSIEIDNSSGTEVLNNNLVNFGEGAAADVRGNGSVSRMDHNNIFAPTAGRLASFNSVSQNSLSSWQLSTGFDLNSVSADPQFYGRLDFRLCAHSLDNIGTTIPDITLDFENNGRNSGAPDPGAIEFASLSRFNMSDQHICNGDTAFYMATVGTNDTVVWNTTDTTNSFFTSVAGQYTVSANGYCGSNIDTFHVVINSPVEVSKDTNLCEGQSIVARLSIKNGTYQWNTGETSDSLVISKQAQYFVDVQDADGCLSSDTIEVTVSAEVSLGSDTAICKGTSAELNPGTGAGTYEWYLNGQLHSTASLLFAQDSGEYIVEFTDAHQCPSTDTIFLTIHQTPLATFSYKQNQNNVEYLADDTTGIHYFWSFGDGKTVSGPYWKTINHYTTSGTKTYPVTLTVTSEFCGDSVYQEQVTVLDVGVDENTANNSISLYPNPNQGQFVIGFDQILSAGTYRILITSADGKVVFNQPTTGNTERIDLSHVPKGFYLLQITRGSDRIYQHKLSIQ